MTNLNEGLLRNDLDNLILPMLDIDTFESKIDNSKVIVVAFYIFDRDPANDLKIFIEKSNVYTLDTEVSPAPTVDGYYVLFVEMNRHEDFPEELMDIMNSVNNLTNVEKWQFQTLGSSEIYDLSEKQLKEHINLDPAMVPPSPDDIEDELDSLHDEDEHDEETEEKSKSESAVPFLRNGLMESILADDDTISLRTPSSELNYKVVYVSETEPSVAVICPQIGDPLISESVRLARILGNSYTVETVNEGFLVSCDDGYLILKPVD